MAGESVRRRVPVDAALRVWSDLAPDPAAKPDLVVAAREESAWMGLEVSPGLIVSDGPGLDAARRMLPPRASGMVRLRQLRRIDAMHESEYLLRLGWVFLAGTTDGPDGPRRVLQPLVSRPVRIVRESVGQRIVDTLVRDGIGELQVAFVGETEVNPLVEDAASRAAVLAGIEFGGGAIEPQRVGRLTGPERERLLSRLPRLRGWIHNTAEKMGFHVDRITAPADPTDAADQRGITAVVGSMFYITRDTNELSVRTSLLNWAGRPGLTDTALGAMLGHAPDFGSRADDTRAGDTDAETIRLPLVLSASQEQVVRTARRAPVTVVSGAPGTGKTHTLCAVAVDNVARGGSVLIATSSRAATDAVVELLTRTPGPDPVRFGDGAAMSRLLDDLEQRRANPMSMARVAELDAAVSAAEAMEQAVHRSIVTALGEELSAASAETWDSAVPALMADAPNLFEIGADHEQLARDLADASAAVTGWWSRRTVRRALRRVRSGAGASEDVDVEQIRLALRVAVARRSAARLAESGGTRIGPAWSQLEQAVAATRSAIGDRLAATGIEADRLARGGAASLSDLISALRAGRGTRRVFLAQLPIAGLTSVTPLWIGTLGDIEDVLPTTPGLFDLVILDEASQIEQSRAAGALVRGRRAMVVGDPRQLRFTSFMSDERVDAAIAKEGLIAHRAMLDVRRMSAFDLASAVGTSVPLTEHFRSAPHLIGFSLRRFYRDQVAIMTTTPSNEGLDCIDMVSVASLDSADDDHESEAAAVVDQVVRLVGDGVTDIGVISPFRAHADVLERRLGELFDTEEIRRLRLRVGTVHGFQGSERDVVVIAPGLSPHDPPGRVRFVEDPHLFNVMVSRARRRSIVVTVGEPAAGLLGDYLKYGETGLVATDSPSRPDGWITDLARAFDHAQIPVRRAYGVGPWHLDLVVGGGTTAVETHVVAEGPEAHLRRHLTLASLGWHLVDAFASRWEGDPAAAVIDLLGELASDADSADERARRSG